MHEKVVMKTSIFFRLVCYTLFLSLASTLSPSKPSKKVDTTTVRRKDHVQYFKHLNYTSHGTCCTVFWSIQRILATNGLVGSLVVEKLRPTELSTRVLLAMACTEATQAEEISQNGAPLIERDQDKATCPTRHPRLRHPISMAR